MFKKIQGLIKSILKKEYAKASIYYVIANIIGQGIVLISSAFFTRMMSKTDYGLVSTYSTWVLVLNTFISLNLYISVRTAYMDFKDDYDNYNSSVLMLSILCGIVMTMLIVGITQILGMNLGLLEVLLACLQSVALNVVNCMLAIQSMKNEYKQRAFMMIAPNWTHTFMSVILMLIFTGNLYVAKITGNAFGLIIFGGICAVVLFSRAKPRIIPRYWKYSLKISVPSIFHTLSDLILMQSDRLMLTSLVGAEETAEYSVVYNVSSIIIALYQAINGAWVPWFFEKVKENDGESIKKYQGYYMLFFSLLSCGMMTISPELIKIMSPRNYWSGIRYVAAIVVASYLIFMYSFFSAYLLYLKRTTRIAVNTIVSAVLNVGLNLWLIPQYKAIGAVIATVVAYAVLFIIYMVAVLKEGRGFFSIPNMWTNIVGVSVFGIIFYFIRNMWWLRYLIFVFIAGMVYLICGRKLIKELEENSK